MQPIEVKSLGFKLNKAVPDSIEEFDKLAKESGAGLREANRNVLYRSTLASFRNTFLHGADAEGEEGSEGYIPAIVGLDKKTGIERAVKVTKPAVKNEAGEITTDEVSAWDETEDDYFKRVLATLVKDGKYSDLDTAQASLLAEAQAVLDMIPFDPSKTERKSAGPKKTPANYIKVADYLVTKAGSIEAAVAGFTKNTGTVLTEVTRDALAAAIWADQKKQSKIEERAKEYAA